jgi:Mn2+/Fe2+ NRAMP family transporter
MTARAKFIIMNVAIMGTLAELAFVDHTPVSTLAISGAISFVLLNSAMFYGLRMAAKRKNSKYPTTGKW